MNKIISYLCLSAISLIFLATNFSSVNESYANTQEKSHNEEAVEKEYVSKQSDSLKVYFYMKESMEKNNEVYAGTYIDDDGNLNILQTENIGNIKNRADSVKKNNQQIKYHIVKYSMSFLKERQKNLLVSPAIMTKPPQNKLRGYLQ